MTDVVLVQMPFAGIERPSIALGLISTTLKAAGIDVSSVYSNIAYGERFGIDVHVLIENSSLAYLTGEWIFAGAAFPEHRDSQAVHLHECAHGLQAGFPKLAEPVLVFRGLPDMQALLRELRDGVASFVEEQAARILDMGARVVACTSMFQQHTASLALLRAIKRRAPDVVTVIGGSNCMGLMGMATHRAFDWIDYTATGEIDTHAASLFGALLELRSRDEDPDSMPSHVLGRRNRTTRRTTEELSHYTADMSTVATPDYDDYFDAIRSSVIGQYIIPSIQFEGSRGCWWGAKQHCTFCGLNASGMAYRLKSAEKVKQEIDHLSERHGVLRLSAVDNIIDLTYFKTLLPDLAADEREFELFYETKANLNEEQVEMLAKSGARWIQPGIESLRDESLELLKKGTSSSINIQLLKLCLEAGVHPIWNLLSGLPGEPIAWIREMSDQFPVLYHLTPPQGAGSVRFDRFSPYFERRQDYALTLQPFGAYRCIYPLGAEALFDLAYFFEEIDAERPERLEVEQELKHLQEVIKDWQHYFWFEKQPPELVMEDDGAELRIRDTRPVSAVEEHRLSGLSAEVYRLMREPTTAKKIRSRLAEAGRDVSEETVAGTVEELVAKHLVWQTHKRIMAVACKPARRGRPSMDLPPWGQVNLRGLFDDRRRFLAWKTVG